MKLAVVQLLDSAFPTGVFSHSFGLETAVQEGRVRTREDLAAWLGEYLAGSLAPTEGIGVLWAHAWAGAWMRSGFAAGREEEDLRALDRRLTAMRLPRESREGSVKIGRRYAQIAEDLYPEAGLGRYRTWIREGVCSGQAAVVHGWICAHLGTTPEEAVAGHLYAGVNGTVQNALRLAVVGQSAAQSVLRELIPEVERHAAEIVRHRPGPEDMASGSLLQEIAAMRHETLYSRMFMS